MLSSTGLIGLHMSQNLCTSFIKFTMNIMKFFLQSLNISTLWIMSLETCYPQQCRLSFWEVECIVLCFFSGKCGKCSSAQNHIVVMNFRGVQQESFSLFQGHHSTIFTTAKTSVRIVELYTFGIFSQTLQKITSTKDIPT